MGEIDIEDVSFSYRRRRVLDRVSWRLGPGVTGLLGPNGAGKTTLLHLLVGVARPSSGGIVTRGFDGDRLRVGFVPQRFSIPGEMRVRDTVAYAAWVNGVTSSACAGRAEQALDDVGLGEEARLRVRHLSGGQRQRLGIACALPHHPDFLVLDEPTVGLDPGQRIRVRGVIASVGEKVPVLLSTHLIEDVSHLCGRVGILAGGRIAFDGTIADLEAMVDDSPDADDALGSRFERRYQQLVDALGGSRD